MSRSRKDGTNIHCYLDTELARRLRAYAAARGQTVTKCLEEIVRDYLDNVPVNQCLSVALGKQKQRTSSMGFKCRSWWRRVCRR